MLDSGYGEPASYPGSQYVDKGVVPATYHYYGIYVLVDAEDNLWLRGGVTACLANANFNSAGMLWNLIPDYFKLMPNGGDLTTDSAGNSYLQQFLQVVGWGLDYLHTQYSTTLKFLNDPLMMPINDLYSMSAELGLDFSPEVPAYTMRKAVANVAHVDRERGTLAGLRNEIVLRTSWDADVTMGPNILLSDDQSQFLNNIEEYHPARYYMTNEIVAVRVDRVSGEIVDWNDYPDDRSTWVYNPLYVPTGTSGEWAGYCYYSLVDHNNNPLPTGPASNDYWMYCHDKTDIWYHEMQIETSTPSTWEVVESTAAGGVPPVGSGTLGTGLIHPLNQYDFTATSFRIQNLTGSPVNLWARSIARTNVDLYNIVDHNFTSGITLPGRHLSQPDWVPGNWPQVFWEPDDSDGGWWPNDWWRGPYQEPAYWTTYNCTIEQTSAKSRSSTNSALISPQGTLENTTAQYVQNVCTGKTPRSQGNYFTLTVDDAVTTTPGNVVILIARSWGGSVLTSVTDSEGNAWQIDNIGASTGSNVGMASAVMGADTYLSAGDTITVTASGSIDDGSQYPQAGAAEFSGLLVNSDGFAVAETNAHAHVSIEPVTVESTTAGGYGDLAVTAFASGDANAGTITLTTDDPDSGGTWVDMKCPSNANCAVDMAWQSAAGESAYSATWADHFPTGKTTNVTGIITVYAGAGPGLTCGVISSWVQCPGGSTVTAVLYAMPASVLNTAVTGYLHFYDQWGGAISPAVNGTPVTPSGTTWTAVSVGPVTAPDSTCYVAYGLWYTNANNADLIYSADVNFIIVPPEVLDTTVQNIQAIKDGLPVPWVRPSQQWSPTTRYGTGNIVLYEDQPFVALRASTGALPPVNCIATTEWAPLSESQRIRLAISAYTSQNMTVSANTTVGVIPFCEWFDQQGNFIARIFARNPNTNGTVAKPDALSFDSFTSLSVVDVKTEGINGRVVLGPWQASYYTNIYLFGTPALNRIDQTIDFDWAGESPGPGIPTSGWSASWTCSFTPPYTASYTFDIAEVGGGCRIIVNGVTVLNNWAGTMPGIVGGSISLNAGTPATVVVQYYDKTVIVETNEYPVIPVPQFIPHTPTHLRAYDYTDTTISIAWDQMALATSYEVRLTYQQPDGSFRLLRVFPQTTECNYVIPGLQGSQTYGCHVVAINAYANEVGWPPEASIVQRTLGW